MAWNGLTILTALADGPRLTRQIAATLGTSSRSANECLRRLRQRGLLTSTEGNHQLTEAGRAALASGRQITSGPCDGAATARKGNNLRARAWRTMQIMEGSGLDDLLGLLCDGSEVDAERNLATYLLALEEAGYLTPMRQGSDGKRRWRLKRDLAGEQAPAWNKKTRVLRDHNTGKTYVIPRRKEASHAA
ncbi:winged helix-turn-helix domain-containing protein [Fundidesulfovibrio agrisoli]|uniref:winged helix-turn-helix domain-containing protein n=1 Tax=Fundidesulfovibrio agrisoli TaxID=2922717 RepID=UPI001FAC8507|nr:winged helix-turn-helix domain-containing protein [Fundidesulfovibrio agrisoli]